MDHLIVAIAAALMLGAVIGRETAATSKIGATVRPASTISFVGTDSADATRRGQVYKALGALDQPTASNAPRLTDAERRALVHRLVSETG
ncbi:MAG: hypothetical protein ABI869_03180 [Actinomycetota bacterium]